MGERAAEARRNRGREGYTYGSSSNRVGSRRNSAEFTQQLILYKVSQKFVPLLYKSVTQYNWTGLAHNLNQSCDFQSNLIFHTSCAIF